MPLTVMARALGDLVAGARVMVVGPEGRQFINLGLAGPAADLLVRSLAGAGRMYVPGSVLWCAKQRRVGVVRARGERMVRLESVADGLPFHAPPGTLRPATLPQIQRALAVRGRWGGA
ncbi:MULTISPECIES: hypothetical protein [Streptomyces]|uniref:hypothetical protein n=1 Tax=Streptomyces TaxID=1883 RepID=UPI0019067BAC|nr:hypothetical protein [Streptomyces sp. XC 2026]QQN77799.1 hypothetical protein IPZ77_10385 [Streptomyces sp. XC 2026]